MLPQLAILLVFLPLASLFVSITLFNKLTDIYIFIYIYPFLLDRLYSLLQVGSLAVMTMTRVIVMDWMLATPIFYIQMSTHVYSLSIALLFYTLGTSQVISGWIPTYFNEHSWQLYNAAPLGDQVTGIIFQYSTASLSCYCPSPILV